MTIWDTEQSIVSAITSILIFISVSLLLWNASVPLWYLIWPGLFGFLFYYLSMRKYIKRRRLVERPFPEPWRETLEKWVRYYRNLSDQDKRRFETDVAIFLSENRITGVKVDITDEDRLLVASSAVILIFGRTGWEYPNVPEILIYPESFDEDFSTTSPAWQRHITGMVAPQNAIVLSKPALYESFANHEQGFHVGLHEFAHLLDMEAWRVDGVPRDLNPSMIRPWIRLILKEMDKVRENRSVLRDYAGKDEAEFFAVAVEYFFEKSQALKKNHPELYEMFSLFFNQDPSERRY